MGSLEIWIEILTWGAGILGFLLISIQAWNLLERTRKRNEARLKSRAACGVCLNRSNTEIKIDGIYTMQALRQMSIPEEKQICTKNFSGPERRSGCKVLQSTTETLQELIGVVETQGKQNIEWQKSHEEADAKRHEGIENMLSVWENMLGFVKVVNILGNVAKWLVVVGVAIGGIWAFITHGGSK